MEKLTKHKVEEILSDIKSTKCEEEAHVKEDALLADFVENIVNNNYNSINEIRDIAQEVFKCRNLDFYKILFVITLKNSYFCRSKNLF